MLICDTEMAGNIIPAIATTNAMTAGLCVLQALKVLRSQLDKAKFAFLTRSTERVIASENLQPPNPHCATCGVAYATLEVDTKRAKLSDLVDVLKEQLGYGEDFSIKRENDLLYDVDEDVHLDKTFEELGLKADAFITVFDEADEDTKVELQLSVIEKDFAEGEKALKLPEDVKVGLKPKKPDPETNGHANGNGRIDATMHTGTNGMTNGATKRKADDAGLEDDITRKKGKVMEEPQMNGNGDDVVVIEDDGAIVLD
jgi:ubiquitin-like 1-activating enzyme E1 B